MNDVIAEIKRDYIYELAKRSERADGRALDEYRPIQVEVGLIGKAEGSARVKIGNTQVLVGVKVQPGEPFPDSPDTGVIITNVELVPLASPSFEPGPPDENAIELARVVDRGVRESGAIDSWTQPLWGRSLRSCTQRNPVSDMATGLTLHYRSRNLQSR